MHEARDLGLIPQDADAACVKLRQFYRIWKQKRPQVRIFKRGKPCCSSSASFHAPFSLHLAGTDYCDYCCMMQHQRQHWDKWRDHRMRAVVERARYQELCQCGSGDHFTFDFAEKILAPRLANQPGFMYYVTGAPVLFLSLRPYHTNNVMESNALAASCTGLKIDIFGVIASHGKIDNLVLLPEGLWPGGKSGDEILSMVYHIFTEQRGDSPHVNFSADNAGNNKSSWVAWFCAWLVYTGQCQVVTLNFFIAGHSKNR